MFNLVLLDLSSWLSVHRINMKNCFICTHFLSTEITYGKYYIFTLPLFSLFSIATVVRSYLFDFIFSLKIRSVMQMNNKIQKFKICTRREAREDSI